MEKDRANIWLSGKDENLFKKLQSNLEHKVKHFSFLTEVKAIVDFDWKKLRSNFHCCIFKQGLSKHRRSSFPCFSNGETFLLIHLDSCRRYIICYIQVNRIRELPQNSKIVATHTDSPDVSTVQI